MAPAAHLINLKVLGADGTGEAADVIEAIDWAIKYRKVFGIRIVNLSLGAAPTQSHKDDPICLAVERAAKAGLVVVASAGNYGQTPEGKLVFGSVTSPGISPFAITVGALRTQGTADPSDDEVAPWSSKGPTMIDHIVKPDLVAPGSKIVSTAVKTSSLATAHPESFINGPGDRDYISMSGTSMAAAVVSGAVALLLDGKSDLTPLQVKVALQISADFISDAGLLAGGAGELDLKDLGDLEAVTGISGSRGFAFLLSKPIVASDTIVWGADTIVWGADTIVWGADTIVWGADTIVWGADTIVWGADTIVWGADTIVWGADTIVWGADTIVWGADTIVWGADTIVWGADTIVWGADTIVWGADTIVWGADTIVWGASADTIVWGQTIVWGA
jgi:serine protease AprX